MFTLHILQVCIGMYFTKYFNLCKEINSLRWAVRSPQNAMKPAKITLFDTLPSNGQKQKYAQGQWFQSTLKKNSTYSNRIIGPRDVPTQLFGKKSKEVWLTPEDREIISSCHWVESTLMGTNLSQNFTSHCNHVTTVGRNFTEVWTLTMT